MTRNNLIQLIKSVKEKLAMVSNTEVFFITHYELNPLYRALGELVATETLSVKAKFNANVVSVAMCDECDSAITEFCDNHDSLVCEGCHEVMIKECHDTHGTAVRDNSDCECVDISVSDRHNIK